MKRLSAPALALVVMLSLAACGGNENGPRDNNGTAPSSSTSAGAPGAANEKAWSFGFGGGDEGFTPIFADYHDDGSGLESYEMVSGTREIPVEGQESEGPYIAASNRSDDLFMGYVKQLDGLEPNRDYLFTVSFELATNVRGDLVGIGGSPGGSVVIKGGVTTAEPQSALSDDGHYRLNIDIGAQSEVSNDVVLLGDMTKPEATAETDGFALKALSFSMRAKTDAQGCAYLMVGTDSGFEGFTEYYLDGFEILAVAE